MLLTLDDEAPPKVKVDEDIIAQLAMIETDARQQRNTEALEKRLREDGGFL